MWLNTSQTDMLINHLKALTERLPTTTCTVSKGMAVITGIIAMKCILHPNNTNCSKAIKTVKPHHAKTRATDDKPTDKTSYIIQNKQQYLLIGTPV